MNTKTLRKRIALVAVSALGFGILSVAPASAALGDGDVFVASGAVCLAKDSAGDVLTTGAGNVNSDEGGVTVTVPLGGSIQVDIDDSDLIELRGGTIIATNLDIDADGDFLTSNINSLGRIFIDNGFAAVNSVQFTATSLGSTTLVADAAGDDDTPSSTSTTALTVTVVAACTTGTVSAADTIAELSTATDTSPNIGEDITRFAAGASAYISIDAENSYGVDVPANTWSVTATNNALVNIDADDTDITGVDDKGTTSFDTDTSDGDGVFVRVDSKTPATASSTVVTVSYAGQVVTTKTINFDGEATKINIVATTVGKTSGGGAIWYTLADAAGNLTAGSISGVSTTYGAQITNVASENDASIFAAAPSGATNGINNSTLLPSTTYGIAEFTCSATSGTASVSIKHTSAITETDIVLPVSVSCAGGLDTYTVAMDKAKYNVGEVAVLTITGKDSKGNPVNDYINTNGGTFGAGTAADLSIGGGTITKATANTDTFGILGANAPGVKKYQVQLTTAGTFNTVVNLGGATTKSLTVGYTVGSEGVSNAEVLKSIVALIASINKQIQALQKLILKR
jgi:hypothetical protein